MIKVANGIVLGQNHTGSYLDPFLISSSHFGSGFESKPLSMVADPVQIEIA